jgi:hypothetical protein
MGEQFGSVKWVAQTEQTGIAMRWYYYLSIQTDWLDDTLDKTKLEFKYIYDIFQFTIFHQ